MGGRGSLRALAAELAVSEERERQRIATGLHDEVGQMLGIAKIKLGEALAAQPTEKVAGLVSEGRQLINRAIHRIRTLTFELGSPVLQQLGLSAALASLAERLEGRHGIPCRFEQDPETLEVSEELAVLLHSVVRELLWNLVKHAGADQAVLRARQDEDRLWLSVEDDGVGFDTARAFDPSGASAGLGLLRARERLHSLGGTFEIDSVAGRGTRIVLTVPNDR